MYSKDQNHGKTGNVTVYAHVANSAEDNGRVEACKISVLFFSISYIQCRHF